MIHYVWHISIVELKNVLKSLSKTDALGSMHNEVSGTASSPRWEKLSGLPWRVLPGFKRTKELSLLKQCMLKDISVDKIKV